MRTATYLSTALLPLCSLTLSTNTIAASAFSIQPQHQQQSQAVPLPELTTVVNTPNNRSSMSSTTTIRTTSSLSAASQNNANAAAGKVQLVPPSKSLRHKLKLPAIPQATTLASTKAASSRPRIVGHRGSLYQELENTRPAFMACAGICDAVELDVFILPRDGTLVVFHGSGTDQNPGLLEDYCTNADAILVEDGSNGQLRPARSILDLTFEQTQQLTFNPDFNELAAPDDRVLAGQIPTLEQVLADMKLTGMEVKIELKGLGTARPVVELVDRLSMANQVSFSSFNHDEIATVRQMRPQTITNPTDGSIAFVYRTGALYDALVPVDFIQRSKAVGASEVHLRYDTCSVDRIEAMHRAGLGSMAWMRGPVGMKSDTMETYWDIGNEDEACYAALIEAGVQQLCVNKPKVLLDYINSQHLKKERIAPTANAMRKPPLSSTQFQAMATIPPQMRRSMIAARS